MNVQQINKIFDETEYVRVGGTPEELQCAKYLQEKCAEMGLEAYLEPFEVEMADIEEAKLYIDGKEVECKGFKCAGSWDVEADLIYLTHDDEYLLKQCKGKIVLLDGGMGYWKYQDLLKYGAVGVIVQSGNFIYPDKDIYQSELRSYVSQGNKMPCMSIHVTDAIEIVKNEAKKARIVLKQNEYKGTSYNVVLDMPGEIDETIALTAHYDSVPGSVGAWDNMSGSVGLLGIAEYFKDHPHRYGLKFIWCGSEERGLLGSKAYCYDEKNEEALKKTVLNVNIDMIGTIMGKFACICTSEEKFVHYMEYLSKEYGFSMTARCEVYSSDSTPFADKGIPAISFVREAPRTAAILHNRYDTKEALKAEQMIKDIDFMNFFVDRMANAAMCPVKREMPDKMKEKLDIYLNRKRG